MCFFIFFIFTNVIGDNEDTTPHDQSSEGQFIPSSPNLFSYLANQITWPSLGEFADHIIFFNANYFVKPNVSVDKTGNLFEHFHDFFVLCDVVVNICISFYTLRLHSIP